MPIEPKNCDAGPIVIPPITLSCETDSITICPGVDPIPVTLSTVAVTQGTSPWVTDDLTFASDKVDVSGSAVTVSGTVSVTQPITVNAVDLDIRNLVFATDKVDTSGSVVALDAPTLAALEVTTANQGTSPWVISGTVMTTGLTDAQLRATPVPISGTVTITDGAGPITVDGNVTPADNLGNPIDTVGTASFNLLWDAINNQWVRQHGGNTASDTVGALGSNTAASTQAFLYGFNNSNYDRIRSGGNNTDGEAVIAKGSLKANAYQMVYDESNGNWIRARPSGNNSNDLVLSSAAHTVTVTSASKSNPSGRGAHLFFDITDITLGTTLTLSIENKDPISGNWVNVFTGPPETAIGTYQYIIYPGVTTNPRIYRDPLGFFWRVVVTPNNAVTTTYSIGVSVLI